MMLSSSIFNALYYNCSHLENHGRLVLKFEKAHIDIDTNKKTTVGLTVQLIINNILEKSGTIDSAMLLVDMIDYQTIFFSKYCHWLVSNKKTNKC